LDSEGVELGGEVGELWAFYGCGGHEIILNLCGLGGLWGGMSILRNEVLQSLDSHKAIDSVRE
jgi:hypothetical protein